MDVLWHSDRDLQSYQEGGDLKQRRTRFLPCPSSFRLWSWRVWRLEGGRCATAACYYHPRIKILFSYIYHKHFIAQLLSLPLGCICHRSDRTKRRLSFLPPTRTPGAARFLFPLSIPPNLPYGSVGLKVHLFQLANDLFWAVGKYLSQLVLVLKSLRDGAEGSAKSINLSENGDMIYAGWVAHSAGAEGLGTGTKRRIRAT